MNNFETIYKENYQNMYCIALKMINDRDAVCDILQEVFISYHIKSQNANNIDKPKSWLIRATINKSIDYLNYQKKHIKIDSIEPISVIERVTEKNQDKEIIKRALSKLKPKEKTLAILYSEGLSYKELSEISGIKFTSIGKMLSRTIKKLNEILKKMDYGMY